MSKYGSELYQRNRRDSNSGKGGNGSSSSSNSNSNSMSNSNGSGSGNVLAGHCALCVADNDARLVYTGSWLLTSNKQGTSHSTTTPGSTVSYTFNGSAIVVFGTVPANNDTVGPPIATFTMDNDSPMQSPMPAAKQDILSQPLFASQQLSDDDEHTITVNITAAPSPFTLDYLFVFPTSKTAQDSAGQSKSSNLPSPTKGSNAGSNTASGVSDVRRTIVIVAAVLGSMVFVILVLLVCFLVRRRWRARKERQHIEPACSENWSNRHTVFTSTDSILRNQSSSRATWISRAQRLARDLNRGSFVVVPSVRSQPVYPTAPSLVRGSVASDAPLITAPRHTSV